MKVRKSKEKVNILTQNISHDKFHIKLEIGL
jgi:hypothetical protein